MPPLHLTKVALGCASLDALRTRQRARIAEGVVPLVTRFRPKRADELVGGSLYWIVKHRLLARQAIIGFGEAPDGERTLIALCPQLVAVEPRALRAHQGWRYLADGDAPADRDEGATAALPRPLAEELALLALI